MPLVRLAVRLSTQPFALFNCKWYVRMHHIGFEKWAASKRHIPQTISAKLGLSSELQFAMRFFFALSLLLIFYILVLNPPCRLQQTIENRSTTLWAFLNALKLSCVSHHCHHRHHHIVIVIVIVHII